MIAFRLGERGFQHTAPRILIVQRAESKAEWMGHKASQ